MFKKILVPCNPKKIAKCLEDFKNVERDLSVPRDHINFDTFNKVSDLLWGNLFSDFNHENLLPKHGPGSTEERIQGNQKYVHKIWHERLQPYFPYDSYACFNIEHAMDSMETVEFVSLEEEKPVRIVSVPKTQKGPRIIAIEPVCMQYTQQALSRYIIPKIENFYITRGHLNFSDQSVNKSLAIKSSKDKKLASLDLSAASDRVPLSLVTYMLKSCSMLEWILACRSRRANLEGEVIPLLKFASMGSALCFPIEAMFFFTLIITSRLVSKNLPVTLSNIYKMSRKVYVYGDDLFVPADEVESITVTLADYYCKVNKHKSFWKSNFRESCGMDAFNGCDVTPTYIRRMPPSNRESVNEIISWISTSNQFHFKGYWRVAEIMQLHVEKILGTLPRILETSPSLGVVSFTKSYSINRINKQLHRPEIFGYVIVPVKRKDRITGYNAMVKWELNRVESVKLSFTETPRSGTVRIKRRWTVPY